MTQEPIPLPVRPSPADRRQTQARQWRRRARVRTRRIQELLRAARTPEGRRRNLAPLLVMSAAGGFILGVTIGLVRRRR